MKFEQINKTMQDMLSVPGKGILAADESTSTIGKRFDSIKLANEEENRRNYRLLLATTKDLGQYINGVILFAETFEQKDTKGKPLVEHFLDQGIIPGIKVDEGLIDLPLSDNEKVTKGLDSLPEKLEKYKNLGAKFAKWRNIYSIGEFTPSSKAIKAGSENLARYAAYCQEYDIVPIVEPEILMDGTHTIDDCAHASEEILHELFNALYAHDVLLEGIILKPSMITSGSSVTIDNSLDVADYTLSVFLNHVPAAVPSINFLSGGQTPTQATENLNALNYKVLNKLPWILSFSFGRALQEDCLKAWGGKEENVLQAQKALLKRAKLNALATMGEYSSEMEKSD